MSLFSFDSASNRLSQFNPHTRLALIPLLESLDRLGVDRWVKTLTVDKYLVTVVAVEGSGTISFVDGGSAQAATGGVDAWLRGGGLPVASGTTSVGRLVGVGATLLTCVPLRPHLLYIGPARQGPTTQLGWAPRPRSRVKGPTRSLDRVGGDQY